MSENLASALSAFLQCKTLQDYANAALELIGNPILILGINMTVVACTEIEIDDPSYQYMQKNRRPTEDKTNDYAWRRKMRRIFAEEQVTHANVDGLMILQKVLRVNGRQASEHSSQYRFLPHHTVL